LARDLHLVTNSENCEKVSPSAVELKTGAQKRMHTDNVPTNRISEREENR